MSGIFGEETTVGGIPCAIGCFQDCLPKNKKKRETVFRISIVILTYVTYSLFNMARRPSAVVKSKIIDECDKNQTQITETKWCSETFFEASTEEFMGFLDSVYVAAYGFSLYISGVIADCYNPRYYLTCGCILAGFFCSLLGLADLWGIRSFKFFTMILILFGAAQSTGWPVALSCVTHWHKGGKRGMFFGFWNTHNYVGSVLGIYIAGSYVDLQWRWSFFIPGFILAIMGLVIYSCMVVDPNDLKNFEDSKKGVSVVRRTSIPEQPQWLSSSQSITMLDALRLPGVIEFSVCMFFSRMVGYSFLYWLPTFIMKTEGMTASIAAYYSIAYVLGGSMGGVVAGILVDLFKRSAVVCLFFLLVSIPILLLTHISELGKNIAIDFPIYMIVGLFVEAPYVVTSTSVSADLGTHKMIKRNHRAISTIGGIMEGTGALGAAIGTYMCGVIVMRSNWNNAIFYMMAAQFVAMLCLLRQAYTDFKKKQKAKTWKAYWKISGR